VQRRFAKAIPAMDATWIEMGTVSDASKQYGSAQTDIERC
jgi:hypothetical protein